MTGGTIRWLLVLAVWVPVLLPASSHVCAAVSIELYGTFHAMGVIVTIADSDDPDGNADTEVEYRVGTSAPFPPRLRSGARRGHPLCRQSFLVGSWHNVRRARAPERPGWRPDRRRDGGGSGHDPSGDCHSATDHVPLCQSRGKRHRLLARCSMLAVVWGEPGTRGRRGRPARWRLPRWQT
jgi:hypothetical protein